jgi:DNA-binding transcriptional MerR regulator
MQNDPQLFGIGEFSQISGLSVKALRFYDEKGLLKPAQVDSVTGYRYYDGSSADRGRIIARLRELQFSLDEIARILGECGDQADLLGFLQSRHRAIMERIRSDRRTIKSLDQMIEQETEAARLARDGRFTVEQKTLEPVVVAGLRMKGRYEECGRGFAMIARTMGRHLAGKPLCLYYDCEYREDDAEFEPCIPVRSKVESSGDVSVHTLPGGPSLSLIHQGPYPQLGRSYKKILSEARRRGFNIDLPTREVYLKGPGMIFKGNPMRYFTEIQLPIKSE